MKKLYLFFVLGLLITFLSFTIIKADTGPKPSCDFTITDLEKSDYFVAVVYEKEAYGPHGYYDRIKDDELKSLFKIVEENANIPEGYYLLDIGRKYFDTTSIFFECLYMAPTTNYKIVIYDLVNNKSFISNEINNYGFESHYSFSFKDYTNTDFEFVSAKASYIWRNIGEFFLRLVVTLAIELLLALLFRFIKKSLLIIALTNVVTQIVLNLILTFCYINTGKSFFIFFFYAFAELLVLFIEEAIYLKFCENKNGKGSIMVYCVLANLLSFFASFIIWIFL